MKKQWQIRKADIRDSLGLQICMELAYSSYQSRMGGNRLPPMDVNYEDEINEYPCWVAEHKGKVVGGLIMMFDKNHASIANIAVHPEFQGQGIGGGLMRFAEDTAKKKNFAELNLATHVLLIENISLYLHMGWTEVQRDNTRVYFKKVII